MNVFLKRQLRFSIFEAMSANGIVYENLMIYRLLMNLLYTGSYRKRFYPITDALKKKAVSSVTELCFGDLVIAEFCKSEGISWKGYDLNAGFVKHACKKGFNAEVADVVSTGSFPEAGAYVVAGSLYHFTVPELEELLLKILSKSKILLISEPVKNLSDEDSITGRLAGYLSRTSRKEKVFRYNTTSLLQTMEKLSVKLKFRYTPIAQIKKDMVLLIEAI